MSIVALKRKGQILNTLSGKSPKSVMVLRDPNQNVPFSSGGGFSLNGKERNIGYIGKSSAHSSGGTRMKSGTNDWKGNGGTAGKYVISPSPNHKCCVMNVGVKPSTLNTKGMLSLKYRWKKSNVPNETFTREGFEVPAQNQIQHVYNRWVSNNTKYTSSSDKTTNLTRLLTFYNPPKEEVKASGCNNQGYHIGGRYVPPKPYSKFLNKIGNSNRAISNVVAKRATPFPKGYNRPYPPNPPSARCVRYTNQAYDPNTLKTYYSDQNNTTIFNCPVKKS